MTTTVVIDSCVFNKIYVDEPDRGNALAFLEYARSQKIALIAPSLLLYEVLAVAARTPFGAPAAFELIQDFQNGGFELVEMDEKIIGQAIVIANRGHPKSGYPSLYDSTYHALAMVRGGLFLTSDAKHVAKAASFGSVVALRDWETVFPTR